VAAPWSSSRDLQLPRSNFALHHTRLRLLHETTLHNPRNLACSATLHPHCALPPNQSLLRAPFYLFPATILRFCTSRTRSLIFCPLARLTRAVQKLPPLHSICIRPASAAPAASF
jgi:hypothetical protein